MPAEHLSLGAQSPAQELLVTVGPEEAAPLVVVVSMVPEIFRQLFRHFPGRLIPCRFVILRQSLYQPAVPFFCDQTYRHFGALSHFGIRLETSNEIAVVSLLHGE